MAPPPGIRELCVALLPEGRDWRWWPAFQTLTLLGQATLYLWKTTLHPWAASLSSWESPVHGEVEPSGGSPPFWSHIPGGRCSGKQIRLTMASALST